MHFLAILEIFSLLAILDPIYPRRYLRHDSIPFFPLAQHFTTFCSGMQKNQNFEIFWMNKVTLDFSCLFFSTFPFSPFVIFFWHWLTFYWSCFRLENVQLTIIKTGNFYNGVVTGNFSSKLPSNFWAFSHISQASLSQSLWSGYHWKDLFLLQIVSIDYVHFGQR